MSVPGRFVHVGFYFTGPVPVEKIQEVFSTALDWLRYDVHCWMLYSTTELNVWRDRLRNVPEISTGEFFLCEFDATPDHGYAGWMKKNVWDWINKSR
jgi:hypothetical protein